MLKRVVVFIILAVAILIASQIIQSALMPQIGTDLALNQMQYSDTAAAELRAWQALNFIIQMFAYGLIAVAAFLIFAGPIQDAKNKKLGILVLVLCGMSLVNTGCWKQYDKPEYVNIDSNETAFLIPLEGNTEKQAALDSLAMLEKHKIAAKRIQITHRWNQTGRWEYQGEWIPNVRVIKVSRTPVTREWMADKDKGTASKDEAIWVESADSVGFSTGVTCTALIMEADTALFLYSYNGQGLEKVMDTEIRARVQTYFAEFSAKYPMDTLRSKKSEMMKSVKDEVVPFFGKKGITITTIGQYGGFTYENPDIQKSIDRVFVSQQEKEVAKALLEAQKDKNTKMEMEGAGEAAKLRKVAEGQKDAAITEANGRAQAISVVAEATKKAGQDPLFLELRKLEVKLSEVNKWDGKYPIYMMNMAGGGSGLLLNLPTPDIKEPVKEPAPTNK